MEHSEPMTPFESYSRGGREPLGSPRTGDGTCRHGYGPPVFSQCGSACVYCGRELLDSYEAWLDVSIDHVVPRSVSWYSRCRPWVDDLFNLATCCRACNEFLNQFKCGDSEPATLNAFLTIRDRVFAAKHAHANQRHNEERSWYDRWTKNGRPAI